MPIPQLIDRLLIVAEANDIPAMVVVNKCDLASAEPVIAHLEKAGYEVIATAARSGLGIDLLRSCLVGKESVLTGPSGAGKSSLLNALEPGLGLRVGEVSAKLRRGTHTTVTAAMIPLAEGGFVADTPGFSEVGVWAIDRAHLDECCRFDDCTHRTEPGCAVRALLATGELNPARYASYLAIFDELATLPRDWE